MSKRFKTIMKGILLGIVFGVVLMVTSCGPKHEHDFTKMTISDEYLVSEATCTKPRVYYYSCECGEHGEETFEYGILADHSYVLKNTDNKYLASAATCTEKARYYYSCQCGAMGNKTFENGKTIPHDYCLKVIDEKYLYTDADCTHTDVYYYSCKCGAKGTEVFSLPTAKGHEYTIQNPTSKYMASSPTCTSPGTYYYSCTCGDHNNETFEYGKSLGHMYELDENGNPRIYDFISLPTNNDEGIVQVRCTRCNDFINIPYDSIDYQDYIIVPYIEGNGREYIDSGFTINQNDQAVLYLDYQLTRLSSGDWAGSNCFLQYKSDLINTLDRSNFYISYNLNGDYVETITNNKTLLYFNNWKSYQLQDVKLTFFYLGNYGNVLWNETQNGQNARIYKASLNLNGKLVAYYLPVINSKTGETGLLNLINNEFVSNGANNGNLILPTGYSSSITRYPTDTNEGILSITYPGQSAPIEICVPKIDDRYKLVEYIGSTGNEYINTGVTVNYYDKLYSRNDMVLYPNQNTWTGSNFYLELSSKYVGNITSRSNFEIYYNTENKKDRHIYVDGSLISDYYCQPEYVNEYYCIFRLGNYNRVIYGTKTSITPARFYGGEISVNGKTYGYYYPAIDTLTGEAGIYDVVTRRFLTNEMGNGSFSLPEEYGQKITALPTNYEAGTLECNYPCFDEPLIVEIPAIDPSEYLIVDCIETSGVDYIDTNIVANYFQHIVTTFDYQFLDNKAAWSGIDWYGEFQQPMFNHHNRTTITIDYNRDGDNMRYIYDNDELIQEYQVSIYYEKVKAGLFKLGYPNDTWSSYECQHVRFYGGSIYIDGKIAAYYIPVMRVSDEVVGVYDIISQTFLTNSNPNGNLNVPHDYQVTLERDPFNSSMYSYRYTCSICGHTYTESSIAAEDEKFDKNTYTRISYIEGTGSEYIDTGIKPSDSTKTQIVITPDTDYLTESAIFGSNWSTNGYFLMLYQGNVRFHSQGTVFDSIGIDSETLTIETSSHSINEQSLKVNGVTTYETTSSELVSDVYNNIYIFKTYDDKGIEYNGHFKLHSFKIWDNNRLMRDYIPVYRNSDNVVGLLDLVNNKFYESNGEQFISNEIEEKFDIDTTLYRQLEYIESTGSQFIDTGIKVKDNYKISINYMYTSYLSDDCDILGSDGDYSNPYSILINNFNGHQRSAVGDNCTIVEGTQLDLYTKYTSTFTFEGNNFVHYLNNRRFTSAKINPIDCDYSLYLFARNKLGTADYYSASRIYSFKVYDGTNIVALFVPVMNIVTGEAGFVDIVNNEFHPNLGSGYFKTGKVIEHDTYQEFDYDNYYRLDSITSDGSSYIDTEIVPTLEYRVETYAIKHLLWSLFGSGSHGMVLTGSNSGKNYAYIGTTSTLYIDKIIDNTIPHKWGIKEGVAYCDSYVSSGEAGTVSPTENLFIFGRSKNGQLDDSGEHTIYYFKIWNENDELVRYYIPAQRKSDGELGLYDTISKTFFTNAGKGSFSSEDAIKDIGSVDLEQYEVIDYLESTGNEYIGTNVVAEEGHKYQLDLNVSYNDTFIDNQIMGFTGNLGCGIGTQTNVWWECSSLFVERNHKYNLSWSIGNNSYQRVFDGIISEGNTTSIIVGKEMLLFAAWLSVNSDTIDYFCNCKLYTATIYDNGEVVRNYIPVRRLSDGVLGLYDTVNNKFYESCTNSKFREDPNTGINLEFDYETYDRLEYLESSGEQYIDTGVFGNNNSRVLIKYLPLRYDINGEGLFGSRISCDDDGICVFTGWSAKNFVQYDNTYVGLGDYSQTITNIDFNKNEFYLNGSLLHTFSESEFTSPRTMTLFGVNDSNSNVVYTCKARIYSCEIFDDSTIVRNYIPALRKSDGKPGLFDTVTNTFYTNSGAGEFTYPSDYNVNSVISSSATFGDSTVIFSKGGNGWGDSGIISKQTYDSAYLHTTIGQNNRYAMIGFTPVNNTFNYTDGYYVYPSADGVINIYELGTYIGSFGSYLQNDTFNVFYDGSKISYYHNDTLLREVMANGKMHVAIKTFTAENTIVKNISYGEVQKIQVKKNIEAGFDFENYEQLTSIQATGTQYIDTGFSTTDGMVAEYMANWQNAGYIVGSHSTTDPYGRNGSYLHEEGLNWEFGYGNTCHFYSSSTGANLNQDYFVKFSTKYNGGYLEVDGIRIATGSGEHTSPNNVRIFSCEYPDTEGTRTSAILYYCKIWDSKDNLVRDFVPARRKSDGTIGLYDKVNNKFYESLGGDFEYTKENEEPQNIDDGYYVLEYIESTGTQYIDTGVVPDSTTTMECKVAATSHYIFGCGRDEGYGGNAFLGSYCNGSGLNLEYGAKGLGYAAPINGINTIKTYIENGNYCVNNNGTINSTPLTDHTTNGHFLIGAVANLSTQVSAYKGSAKYYYIKLFNNGVVVRDFIPVMRKDDGKVGLYDKVNKEFYSSIEGNFVSGSIVGNDEEETSEYIQLEYIESTGSQEIDTGLTFNMENDSVVLDFQSTKENQNGMIFASKDSLNFFWFYHYIEGNRIALYNSDSYSHSTTLIGQHDIDLYRHTMKYENKTISIDGEVIGTDNRSLNTTDYNIFLCSWGGNYFYYGKIFSCKIYKSGVLVRDFIPVMRKDDGKVGLYDKVNNEFYGNSGSGSFIAGNIVETEETDFDYDNYDMLEFVDQVNVGPDEPEQHNRFTIPNVKYDFIEADLSVVGRGTSGGIMLAGCNLMWWATWQDQSANVTMMPTSIDESEKTHVEWQFSGTSVGLLTCGWTDDVNIWTPQHLTIYSLKTYNSSVLTGNFVPAQRKSDGEIGLYDTVTKQFFTNTGSGQIVGSDVINPTSKDNKYERIDYLEINGLNYVSLPEKYNERFEVNALSLDGKDVYPIYENGYRLGYGNAGKYSSLYLLYELTSYYHGRVLHHYVPVKRSSDGKVGLYDTVYEKFYQLRDAYSSYYVDMFYNDSSEYNVELSEFGTTTIALNQKTINELEAKGFHLIDEYDVEYDDDGNVIEDEESIHKVPYSLCSKDYVKNGELYHLYYLIISGTVGENEWTSNFTVGNNKSGFHMGFEAGADFIIEEIQELISNDYEHNKMIIYGHSRGAAISSIISAKFMENGIVKQENMFTYCYACPNYSVRDVCYNNIFQINNNGDMVSAIPLETWGFKREGISIELSMDAETLAKLDVELRKFQTENNKKVEGFTGNNYDVRPSLNKVGDFVPASVVRDTKNTYAMTQLFYAYSGEKQLSASDIIYLLKQLKFKGNITSLYEVANTFSSSQNKNSGSHEIATYYCWIRIHNGTV